MLTSLLTVGLFVSSAFAVEPYLFIDKAGDTVIAWQDDVSGPTRRPVQLFTTDGGVDTVRARLVDGLWRADVPPYRRADLMGYRVPGMDQRVAVKPSTSTVFASQKAEQIRFGFITDTQGDTDLARQAANRLAEHELDFVLHGGDMVQYGGEDDSWPALLQAMAPLAHHTPVLAALGNHDTFFDEDGENVSRYFGVGPKQGWRTFRRGPVLFILLDSTKAARDDQMGEKQRAFLQQAVKEDAPWKVLVFHHPMYSKGIAHAWWVPTDEHVKLRGLFLDIIEQSGIDAVFTGHTHLSERSVKAGVDYIVGGAAGGIMGIHGGENPYSVRSERQRTVTVTEATATSFAVQTYDLAGQLVDSLTLQKALQPEPAVIASLNGWLRHPAGAHCRAGR